jgi:hypothetical protein
VASLAIEDDELVVEMTTAEKLEAVHGEVRVPLAAVRAVRTVGDAWPELRGIRAPGTGIPGKIAVGTRRGSFGSDFAVVHGTGPAVIVELDGAKYSRLVITNDDAEQLARQIQDRLSAP